MAILVTGGKGFIGRRLVKKLQTMGNDVIVMDKEDGGILNRELLESVMDKVSVIFHLGAVSGALFFTDDPIGAVRVNCEGTATLLEIAAKHENVRKVVFAGTMSAYGWTPIPHMENGPISCPNAYVSTKLFGERLMRLYFENRKLNTVCLRFSSVYGIGEETKKNGTVSNPITQFTWNAMHGVPPKIFGDGKQTRDLIFVDDVVGALVAAMLSATPGEVYNVSTDVETSFNEVLDLLSLIIGKKVTGKYTPWKPYDQQINYVDRQRASFDKLHSATGWSPKFSVQTGLRAIVDFYTEHPELVPEGFRK